MSAITRKVVLCGNSVLMSSLGATCRRAGFEVVTFDTNQADPADQLRHLSPDVILYDLAHPPADFVLKSLAQNPKRVLIGVDLDRDSMLVLSGLEERAVTTKDLLQVIENRHGSAASPQPLQGRVNRSWRTMVARMSQLSAASRQPDSSIGKGEPTMKKLNRRSRILIAVGALVVVAVLGGLVLFEPGGVDLFGGTVIHISPENPTINVDQLLDMSINSVGNCTWSSSNPNVVDIYYWFLDTSRKATVIGKAPGQATIKANCWMNRYTTVTVRKPPVVTPGSATIKVGQSITFTTDSRDPTCHWSLTAPSYAQHAYLPAGQGNVGASTVVVGSSAGYAHVSAWDCVNGSARADIVVQ